MPSWLGMAGTLLHCPKSELIPTPCLDACSDQAHKLSQAVQKDAMDAVREALLYECMHEEVHEDEDVGDQAASSSLPNCSMHAHCSMPACGTMERRLGGCRLRSHSTWHRSSRQSIRFCLNMGPAEARPMAAGPSELSIVLCSDAHIAQLNGQWRGKAEATDVLSFPMEQDSGDGCPVRMLGDLVISLDTAARQARERRCASRAMHALPTPRGGLLTAALCLACCEDHLVATQALSA